MSGTIVEVGKGVTRFEWASVSWSTIMFPAASATTAARGTPAQCPLYKKVGVTAGFEPSGGGFAEYIRVMDWIVASRGVVRIPDGVPFEQAAFVEPVNTVLKGVKLLNLALRRHGAGHRPGAHRPDACGAGQPNRGTSAHLRSLS